MKKLKIIWTSDTSGYCETCGVSYAEGFRAYLDGELFDEFEPHAACYDGDSIDQERSFVRILEKLGYEVEVDYEE